MASMDARNDGSAEVHGADTRSHALALYAHEISGPEAPYFLGEHLVADDDTPACGASGRYVARRELVGGFGLVCRACLCQLLAYASEKGGAR